MDEIVDALKKRDPRAAGRDKMIHANVRRTMEKAKVHGEKLEDQMVYWT